LLCERRCCASPQRPVANAESVVDESSTSSCRAGQKPGRVARVSGSSTSCADARRDGPTPPRRVTLAELRIHAACASGPWRRPPVPRGSTGSRRRCCGPSRSSRPEQQRVAVSLPARSRARRVRGVQPRAAPARFSERCWTGPRWAGSSSLTRARQSLSLGDPWRATMRRRPCPRSTARRSRLGRRSRSRPGRAVRG